MTVYIEDEKGAQEYRNYGEVSDGYHTFDELYHYRALYNALWVNALYKQFSMLTRANQKEMERAGVPIKSWRHSDGEKCFGGGWFVVTVELPTGQVSNHYPEEYWDLFDCFEAERAPRWDGHTPEEAASRMEDHLKAEAQVKDGIKKFVDTFKKKV